MLDLAHERSCKILVLGIGISTLTMVPYRNYLQRALLHKAAPAFELREGRGYLTEMTSLVHASLHVSDHTDGCSGTRCHRLSHKIPRRKERKTEIILPAAQPGGN